MKLKLGVLFLLGLVAFSSGCCMFRRCDGPRRHWWWR